MKAMDACCVSGGVIEGTPKGEFVTIAGVETYTTGKSDGKKAVIMFTDVFGLALQNNPLIADRFAEKVKCKVYVPDLFNGSPMPPSRLLDPARPSEARKQSFFEYYVKGTLSSAYFLVQLAPFLYTHWPSSKKPMLDKFVDEIPEQAIAISGYCYGAAPVKVVFDSAANSRIKAIFLAHPSIISVKDLINFPKKTPLSIAFSEIDPNYSAAQMNQVKDTLTKEPGVGAEVRQYEDQVHGFAARPDTKSAANMKAFNEANEQGMAWFAKYLK